MSSLKVRGIGGHAPLQESGAPESCPPRLNAYPLWGQLMGPRRRIMDSVRGVRHRREDGKKRSKKGNWFATFSLMDVSGAIRSSELRSLLAAGLKLWRLTIGRLSDRSRVRSAGL